MNKQKKKKEVVSIERLRNIYKTTDDARENILKCFPYNKMTNLFCQELKILLKNKFRENIEFERDELFGCIHGTYKGKRFEIKTWCGIVLTIENENNSNIIDVFTPIFNEIMETNPLCRYDYCTCTKEIYPTIEWSLHPQERLYELVNLTDNSCTYIKNFQDFYMTNIINSLEDDLLTQEGYNLIFKSKKNNIKYHFYKLKLIKKLRSDLSNEDIYNWIDRCEYYNLNSKQFTK